MKLVVSCVVSGRLREYNVKDYAYVWDKKADAFGKAVKCSRSIERVSERDYRGEATNRARRSIRRLVAANCDPVPGFRPVAPVFITFTFADDVEDIDYAWTCWRNFLYRLRRSDLATGVLRGVVTAEIQEERAKKFGKKVWHFHAIFFGVSRGYKTYDAWRELWSYGQVKALDVADNKKGILRVAGYLSKYIAKNAGVLGVGKRTYRRVGELKSPVTISCTDMDKINKMFSDDCAVLKPYRYYSYSFDGFSGEVYWFESPLL